MSVTRRSVLVGGVAALGAVTTGCRDHDRTGPAAELDPADRAALAAALQEERQILAFYDALPSPGVAAGVAREQHAAHQAALQRLLATGPPTATPSGLDVPVAGVVVSGGRRLQAAAVAARDGAVAALLASVAASHLTPPRAVFEGEWWGAEPR